MSDYTNITMRERQAVEIAKAVKPGQIAIVGTGLPLIGASLAKKVYVPDCILIVESGLMDCSPPEVPTSVGDLRLMAHCAVQWPNSKYIGFQANEVLNGNDRMISFIGGAQIDPYGSVNSTSIGDYHKPKTRFSGSGGANGIASFVNTVIMMQHQKRRFVDKVDFITSPGWLGGPGMRSKAGLPENRGPLMVVTDRGIMKFDKDTKRMYLDGYFVTSSIEDIIENTGFELDVSRAKPIESPTPDIIKIIREEIDPGQRFIKVPVEGQKDVGGED